MARAELVDGAKRARRPLLPLFETKPNRQPRRAAEARERRVARASKHAGNSVKRRAYTIDEFAYAHGFSRAHYYNLKADGLGPDETRALGKILITEEAAARWRKRTAAAS